MTMIFELVVPSEFTGLNQFFTEFKTEKWRQGNNKNNQGLLCKPHHLSQKVTRSQNRRPKTLFWDQSPQKQHLCSMIKHGLTCITTPEKK